MTLLDSLRIQAHANRLINQRLHAAMEPLADAEFLAPRTGYFPSLAATLNHILDVDGFYVGALLGELDLDTYWDRFVAAATLPELVARQVEVDARLIRAALLDPAREIAMPRRDHVQRDSAAAVLMHLFMHQHHHRGQVHAMLSGTAVKPPQLDEFMMPSEAHFRATDMAAAGFREAEVYGPR